MPNLPAGTAKIITTLDDAQAAIQTMIRGVAVAAVALSPAFTDAGAADTGPLTRLWGPADSGIMAAWFDPSADANLAFSGPEIVGAVDLSGNGLDMGIAGTGPLIRGTLNGVQSIFHDGKNRALSRAPFAAAGGYFSVFDSTGDNQYDVLAPGNNTTQYDARAVSGNGSTSTSIGVTRAATYVNGVALANPPTRGDMYAAMAGKTILYAQTDLPGSWTAISPFGYNNINLFSLTGQEGEFIFLVEVPSVSTRQKFEGYLAHKWGLVVNLDVSHPYKTAAPTVTIGALPDFVQNAWEMFRLTDTIGAEVATIADPINGLNLTQAVSGSRGIMREESGLRYLEMDAADDEYVTSSVDWMGGFAWFIAARTDLLTNYRNFAGLGASGGSTNACLFSNSSGAVSLQRRTPSYVGFNSAAPTVGAGVVNLITADSGRAEIFVGRTSVATGAAIVPTSAASFAIGRPYSVLSVGRINGRYYAAYKTPPKLAPVSRALMWDYLETELAAVL